METLPENEREFVQISEMLIMSLVEELHKKSELKLLPVVEFAMQLEEELYRHVLYNRPVQTKEMWKSREQMSLYLEIGERLISNVRDQDDDWKKVYGYFKKESKSVFLLFSKGLQTGGSMKKSTLKKKVKSLFFTVNINVPFSKYTYTPSTLIKFSA